MAYQDFLLLFFWRGGERAENEHHSQLDACRIVNMAEGEPEVDAYFRAMVVSKHDLTSMKKKLEAAMGVKSKIWRGGQMPPCAPPPPPPPPGPSLFLSMNTFHHSFKFQCQLTLFCSQSQSHTNSTSIFSSSLKPMGRTVNLQEKKMTSTVKLPTTWQNCRAIIV